MIYDDARPLIKTGDLLAWSHTGWGNWHDIQISLVRMITRSEYSHIGIACVMCGRVFILEAVGTGVRLYPLSRTLPFYWMQRPQPISELAIEWAFDQLGDKYSKWQAILAFMGVAKRKDDPSWECCTYIQSIYAIDGEEIIVDATPTKMVQYVMERWGSLYYVTDKRN